MHVTLAQKLAIAQAVHATFAPPSDIGWLQEHWGTDDTGEEIVFDGDTMIAKLHNLDAGQRCLCLGGAIRLEAGRALNLDPGQINSYFDETIFGIYTEAGRMELDPEDTLEPHLHAVIRWNDDRARTLSDVRKLTERVRARLRTQIETDTP